MAVHETKKQSDLEKRLRILRQSLSVNDIPTGKKSVAQGEQASSNTYRMDGVSPTAGSTTTSSATHADVLFLKKDLTKTLILSAIAFLVQGGIYFALVNKLIKLPI